MKQLSALPQQNRLSSSFRGLQAPLEATVDGAKKLPSAIFWLVLHGLCCLVSLLLGFRFSRLMFFLLFSNSSSPLSPTATTYSVLRTTNPSFDAAKQLPQGNVSVGGGSRVVVGRHGILIRPWPHPDHGEVMKAHRIIEGVQKEQRSQYGIKSPKTVIAITPTYVRTFQALHLNGVMHSLMNVPYDLVWIVVEAGGITNETASLISKSGLNCIHIEFEEKMSILWEDRHKLETRMRLHALRVVRENRLDGIVMFADDSNMHSMDLFDEIQNVNWIGSVSVGIIVHSGGMRESIVVKSDYGSHKYEKSSQVPVQGPVCNASDDLVGWHTFNTLQFTDRTASYIGDRAVVLPRELEWAGFVLNSRLVWQDTVDRPEWFKELEAVGGNGEAVDSPLSLLKDSSVVEPLGSCGRKVMVWWLRAEARADSKFPPRWIIDPSLDITVPAKRTPWPDTPPELTTFTEKVVSTPQNVHENMERRVTKIGSKRKHRSGSRKKHASKLLNEHINTTWQSGDNY